MSADPFAGRILALETSGLLAGIAVTSAGRLLGEMALDSRLSRTEMLLESVRRLLEDLGLTPGDLDRIAYDEGPGSFTGLRVGMAAALGLAAGAGRPVVAVPSLEVPAYPHRHCGARVVALSGYRRGQVYVAAYEWRTTSFGAVLPPTGLTLEAALERLEGIPGEPLLFVGDAIDSLAEPIRQRFGGRSLIGPMEPPRAAHLAALAAEPDRTEATGLSLEGRTPLYLRDADARKPKRP